MLDLKSYLTRERITQREFAGRLGISQEYLSRIICGHKKPSARLQKHIELETQGEVRDGQAHRL